MTRQYLCDHCGRVLEWRYQGWDNFMEKSITCDVKKIVDQIYEECCGECAKNLWDLIQKFKLKQSKE